MIVSSGELAGMGASLPRRTRVIQLEPIKIEGKAPGKKFPWWIVVVGGAVAGAWWLAKRKKKRGARARRKGRGRTSQRPLAA